jgi:ankyrin repeat protein
MKGRLWKDLCQLKVAKSVPDLRDIINETDEWGKRALFTSMTELQLDTFCYFVDCGANVHIKNMIGEPLLHVAVQRCLTKCIEKLLSAGVDINCTNEYGETVLYDYSRSYRYSEHLDVLKLFLKHKANVNVISKENNTPLDTMLFPRSYTVHQAPILINAGAKLHSLKRRDMDPNAIPYVEKLSACTSASIALRIALRKTLKVHKDVIPLIEALVFQSWEKEEWNK